MIKLQELNRRHLAGISALVLVLAGLGYAANRESRPIEALSEIGGAQIAQQGANPAFESQFLSSLRRLPADAYGSARALLQNEKNWPQSENSNAVTGEQGANVAMQPSANASKGAPLSPASQSKFWSDQEWQVADKAVADFRAGGKAQKKTVGVLTWRPPEEIGQRKPEKSR